MAPPCLQTVLRSAGDELERLYGNELSAQVTVLQLRGNGGGAARRRHLTAIREELFRDGVNWGRIVAMMELGGALSAAAAKSGDDGQMDDIASWMEESLDSPSLRRWIHDNGGWVGARFPSESLSPLMFPCFLCCNLSLFPCG